MRLQHGLLVVSVIVLMVLTLVACSESPTTATAQPTARAEAASPSPTEVAEQPSEAQQTAPACVVGSLTPSQTEGPYYTQGSPERASLLEEGMAGTRIVIEGQVFSRDCLPLANAWLDFWQTDDAGEYDNSGYRLRGHQFADREGRYRLETAVPGLYPGRTRHIDLKVASPGGTVLTTQLYFPGEGQNSADNIFDARLLLPVEETANGKRAVFNFVLDVE
jgi:protocatechuate 3,4-dioxygenase beta subunit